MSLDFRRLGFLLGLRYRLLWANVRSRNGKIGLFLTAYLIAVFIIALLAIGGFGAGLAAIRTGRADRVARIVLGGFFLNALFASIALGVGMNATFSDAALRRYPCECVRTARGKADPRVPRAAMDVCAGARWRAGVRAFTSPASHRYRLP